MDDNPGTGRILDKYLYQALGRRLERWVSHIKMSTLSSMTIHEEIWNMFTRSGIDMIDDLRQYPLEVTSEYISELEYGVDIIFGLNILIKRAR